MKAIDALTAADVMTRTLICARPSQDLVEIERTLINRHIGGVPVVEGDRLVGVVSRSDIARVQVLMMALDEQVSQMQGWDAQADGFQHAQRPEFNGFSQRLDKLKVRDAMRDQVVVCQQSTPVSQVARMMLQQHIHRVIVVENDRPIGIVSSLDLVKLLVEPAAP